MYNLFVSNNVDAWNGEPWQIESGRCIREYTDAEITEQLANLNANSIRKLTSYPCIFSYEKWRRLDPKFGAIRELVERQGIVRVEYDIHDIDPFLTHEELERLRFDLDIGDWEMNRTHWAVKSVNLARMLNRQEIQLPNWAQGQLIDITEYQFRVGLSFPGEARELVEQVAAGLEHHLGPNSYFYDNNYTAQIARPRLDNLLQGIYGERSELVVVFIGRDYQDKRWCGVEWRSIQNIINNREDERVMFVRLDDGDVEGVLPNDGYVDARQHSAVDIARFITERVDLLE